MRGGTLLDVALDGLVAVCATADALGDRSGAIAFADRVLRDVAPSRLGARRGRARALRRRARRRATATTSSPSARVAGGKRGFVLVLADLVDEAAARALVSAVPVLARRHAVCVASVRDDALDALLTRRPDDLRGRLRHDGRARDAAGARPRRAARRAAGAVVVEAPPERFAGACVSAYARAKQR